MQTPDEIEIQPLMPLSGEPPITISLENKSQFTLKPSDKLAMQQQIALQSFPWSVLVITPVLAISLYWIVRRLLRARAI